MLGSYIFICCCGQCAVKRYVDMPLIMTHTGSDIDGAYAGKSFPNINISDNGSLSYGKVSL